jgi:hypothetical protein
MVPMSLKAAAVMMRVCQRQARRILVLRQRSNPAIRIIQRPSGSPEGRIEVNAAALLAIIQGSTDEELEVLAGRVGSCESDIASLRVRVARVENKVSRQELRQNTPK